MATKTYTDRDALKSHKNNIKKYKEAIKANQQHVKEYQEMIKDKTEKMNATDDKELKKKYKDNIHRIKTQTMKEFEDRIKDQMETVKHMERKHRDAEADVSRIENKKTSKSESSRPEKLQKRYDAIKKIVDDESYAKVEGVTLDLFTAGMLVNVLKNLKEENQDKMLAMPIRQMVDVGWKLMSGKDRGSKSESRVDEASNVDKLQAEYNKAKDKKHDAYGKWVTAKEKHGSSDHFEQADFSTWKKLKGELDSANDAFDKAWDKYQKAKKSEAKKSPKSESSVNEKMKSSDIAKQQLARYKEQKKESEELIKKQEERIKANQENSKDDSKIKDPKRKAERKKQIDSNLKNAKNIIQREKEFISKVLPEKTKAAEERLKQYLEDEKSNKSESKMKLASQLMSVVESLNANDEIEKKSVGMIEDEEEEVEDDTDSEEESGDGLDEEPSSTDDLTDLPDVDDSEEEEDDSDDEEEDDKEPVVLENDDSEEEEIEEVDLTGEDVEEPKKEDVPAEYPEDEEALDKEQLKEAVKEFNSFNRGTKRILETKINEDDNAKKKKETLKAKIGRAKDLVKKLRDKMLTYEKNSKAIKAKKKGVRRTPEQIKKDKVWSLEVGQQSMKMRDAWYRAKEYLSDFEDQLEAV